MNTKIITLTTVGFIFSMLFYKESLGLNCLIFSLSAIVASIFQDTQKVRKPVWIASAVALLYGATSFFVLGTGYAFTLTLLALFVFAGVNVNMQKNSAFVHMIHGIFSVWASFILIIVEWANMKTVKKEKSSKSTQYIIASILVFVVLLAFLGIYRSVNPIFNEYILSLDLTIDGGFIGIWIVGFILAYGLLFAKKSSEFVQFDLQNQQAINHGELKEYEQTYWGKFLSLSVENKAGIVLLVCLNLMLFMVNVSDLTFYLSDQKLPEGLTYKEYVHQGVGMLIFSIVLSIGILAFVFRGHNNFAKSNKVIKLLGLLWVLLNVVMIFFTFKKNQLYIEEMGLTFKRIGVIIYLILAIVGLVVTSIKIIGNKKNWYIVSVNFTAFFMFLLVLSPLNWTKIVTDYNFSHANHQDYRYMADLHICNIGELYTRLQKEPEPIKNMYSDVLDSMENRIVKHCYTYENNHWQSFTIADKKAYTELNELKDNYSMREYNDVVE